jgi:succinoglycan biosynthesis transport protein ExoP
MSSNSPKQSRTGSDHGYGYGAKKEGGLQRSLQDYVLILRERIWYIIVVFLVVFSSALVYTLSQTKIYSAMTTMKVQRKASNVLDRNGGQVISQDLIGPEEFGTLLSVFNSASVLNKVADRLTGADLRQFMISYGPSGGTLSPQDFLNANRAVSQRRGTFIIEVRYRHPDPVMAAKVANLFAEEYLNYTTSTQNAGEHGVAADLELRVAAQEKLVAKLDAAIEKFRQDSNMVALNEKTDDLRRTYNSQTSERDTLRNELARAENYRDQLNQLISAKGDLTGLPFITTAAINALKGEIASANIAIKTMEETFGDKMPALISKRAERDQVQKELDKAIQTAVELVRNNAINAKANLVGLEARVKLAEEDVKKLNELTLQDTKMTRERDIELNSLQGLKARLVGLKQSADLDPNPTSILDRAGIPDKDDYTEPKMTVNLSLGVAAGLALGLVFAFFVAYIDDRVKSSFDIESVIGLPLIGIIPQIKKMEQPDKAQIVANNADRQVSEAFLALHSALRLKDESKNGQCILITSTIPGEGKSFVTTNLALTFAAHGERVLIIDCDLRKPNVHKSFRQENLKGLIDVIAGGAAFDDVLIKQLHPNLDVLTTGGRAKNPTQILNSKKFEVMVSDLRKRYDRIFFDTPPLAAVSDALIILPLMDGSLFSIFFNKVRRKAAQFAAKKLLEANVPVYGAVLNALNLTVSGYYYAQYYDKSYKDYYVVMSKGESTPATKD